MVPVEYNGMVYFEQQLTYQDLAAQQNAQWMQAQQMYDQYGNPIPNQSYYDANGTLQQVPQQQVGMDPMQQQMYPQAYGYDQFGQPMGAAAMAQAMESPTDPSAVDPTQAAAPGGTGTPRGNGKGLGQYGAAQQMMAGTANGAEASNGGGNAGDAPPEDPLASKGPKHNFTAPEKDKLFEGSVKTYNQSNGFGFIACQEV